MHIPDHRAEFSIENLPPYLTESEVIAYLRVDPKKLRRMRYDRRGPRFVKICGEYRYPWDGLRSWLSEREI